MILATAVQSSPFVSKTIDVALVAAVVGAVIPFVNALITHINASAWVKSGVAVVLSALATVATWATSVIGPVTVKQLIVVALGALAAAGGSLRSWTSQATAFVASKVPGGIGGNTVKNEPPADATPLPPRKPFHTGQQ